MAEQSKSNVPVPDPSLLTTQQTIRESTALREIFETQIKGLHELVESRIDGMDKAIKLLQTISDRIPSQIDEKITHLRELHQEKFESIQTQFTERDTRTEQTSRDSKVAVDAALQAAKEAVGEQNKSSALAIAKSEAATTKQIDQLGQTIQAGTAGIGVQINDIKERLTRIESEDRGQKAAVTTQQTSNTSLVGIIGLVIGTLIGIGGLITAFLTRAP
jgi:cation transport regulator ChaB